MATIITRDVDVTATTSQQFITSSFGTALILQPGQWMINFSGDINYNINDYYNLYKVGVSTDSGATTFSDDSYSNRCTGYAHQTSTPVANWQFSVPFNFYTSITVPTQYYFKLYLRMAAGSISNLPCRGKLTCFKLS